jgi:hypothetical protein
MPKTTLLDVQKILLEAHRRGVEQAIDTSIRTGVPLVVEKGGEILELKPEYKYVKVPIKSSKRKLRCKTVKSGNMG